jgi:tRNA (mo5U34)-methyltransferase
LTLIFARREASIIGLNESNSEQSEAALLARQAEIDQIHWYHEFDFGGGLKARSRTPDIGNHRRLWRFIEENLDRVDFQGKTVLEIGAWDGYWSFYAERRGAKYVLASDDLTQNWSAGRGILLARELLGSRIEVRQDVSVYELTALGRKFDIILCLGVYYHLLDPFYALTQIRHLCHESSLVVLEGDIIIQGLEPTTVCYNYKSDLPAFLPAVYAFGKFVQAAYFEITSQALMDPVPEPKKTTWYRRRRRREEVLGTRALTICRPFEGVNECHAYPPPFGLKAYDGRFRNA